MLYLFFLPSSLLAAATLAVSPLLLVTILQNQWLRQKTHYLLLANILLSDLAYILLHMLISSSSLGGWELGHMACGILTDAVFATGTSTILSFTATVLHTYLAVTHPLCYLSFMSHGAAWKSVALIWLVSCLAGCLAGGTRNLMHSATEHGHPAGMWTLVIVTYTSILCFLFLCTALIACCFWRIYAEAKTSGIWGQAYSCARGTLLIHSVLITLYVSTGVMFSLDIVLTRYYHIGTGTHTWLLAANSEVLMMLPCAMLSYLYMLCYQQLLGTRQSLPFPRILESTIWQAGVKNSMLNAAVANYG
ncbi:hypothetical protein P7K49_039634 [Saguinus oedipus]|uniref:G-protein coupled receptors family 1 profile domain-containing protein n=1 Tax=Saguinus oedipus TaxID=9490 RepID=A0ABQ9TBE8_SAGOE|nr:hypothetical protein P7K49_039634 [Saguinus oedipus]